MTTHEPAYDFFSTRAPATAAPPIPDRFGSVAPATATAPATAPQKEATPRTEVAPAAPAMPAPATSATPVGTGYAPGTVNQFGTPLDAPSVPTGPYAAPGIGAAPLAGPGILTVGDSASSRHRTRTRAVPRPGTVLAAGIIGIVVGGLGLVLGLIGMLGYAALSSELADLESAPELAGSGLDTSGLTTLLLVGVLLMLASGALYLVAGIATVAGRRWGAWTLIVVSILSIIAALGQMVAGSGGSGVLGILVSAVVVGLLVTPVSQSWLRSSGPA